MQVTQDQIKRDQDEYADAFNSDPEMKQEQSEDEAFGITPERAADESADQPGSGDGAPVQGAEQPAGDTAAGGEVAGETKVEAAGDNEETEEGAPRESDELEGATNGQAEGADGDNGSVAPAAESDSGDPEKERQRLRSWEGRLRKIEADLKAKTDAVAAGKPETNGPVADGSNTESQTADALEGVADSADKTGKPEMAAAADEAAEKVESGQMSVEQAMKQLAEDFGEDFVRMIETIASHKAREAGSAAAGEHVNELRGTVDDIINDIVDSKAKAHFSQIATKHADFADIGQSEGFAKFIESLPDTHRDEAKRVAANGSADQIIDLLDAYKASQESEEKDADAPAADPVVDAQMDAAEGVRSRGMVLPDQPKPSADSYEDAWNELG